MVSEDRLVQPHPPCVCCAQADDYLWHISSLPKTLMSFWIPVGQSFWLSNMHEPLLLVIDLPLTHMPNYRGPWLVKSTDAPSTLEERIKCGFTTWGESEDDPENYMSWGGMCRVCGKARKNGFGLFCTNLFLSRGSEEFPPRTNAWCEECYEESPSDPFPCQGLPEE
jgi:hypothetical protein